MSQEKGCLAIAVIEAIAITGIVSFLGGGTWTILGIFCIVAFITLFIFMKIESKRNAELKKTIDGLSEDKRKQLNVVVSQTHNVFKQNSKSVKNYPIMFSGRGDTAMGPGPLQYGSIAPAVSVIINEDGTVHAFTFATSNSVLFSTVKDKDTQKGTVMMDVQEAARIGNGLGGIGASASAAANAMKINSEGGLKVEHKITVHRLICRVSDAEIMINSLWVDGEQKRIPSSKKSVQELCDTLNEKIKAQNQKSLQ